MNGHLAALVTMVGLAVAAPGGKLQWSDCAAPGTDTVLTVHDMDINPIPIQLPGQIHFSLNLTVNRQIDHLFLDAELYQLGIGGIEIKMPCVGDTNIGSCQNIDSCNILDRVLNGSSVVSQDLGQQIDSMLLAALGHKAQCPIQPETVYIQDEQLTLSEIPAALSMFVSGNYRVKIMVKEDPTDLGNVGCLEFFASIHPHTSTVIG